MTATLAKTNQLIALHDIGLNTQTTLPVLASLQPIFKALADLNRLRLFALLMHGERCVCDLEAILKLPQNLISHHLAALREAKLIQSRRAGRWVYYCVDSETLHIYHPLLCQLLDPTEINNTPAACQ